MQPNPRRSAGTVAAGLALLIAALPASAAPLQDWYVDVQSPGCPGDGTAGNPYCAIMDAVAAAASGDIIHIAPGTYFENLVLDKDLTLIGTGGDPATILDGRSSSSVVRVLPQARVTLIWLNLTNAEASCHGGSLIGGSTTMRLLNCTVTGNSSSGGGPFITDRAGVELPYSGTRANRAPKSGWIFRQDESVIGKGDNGWGHGYIEWQWPLGIDFLPAFRGLGIASIVTSLDSPSEAEMALLSPGLFWNHDVRWPPGGAQALGAVGGGFYGLMQPDFIGSPRQGRAPLTVSFLSMGGNYWNFGDGATQWGRRPTHTYTAPGTYTVSLSACTLLPPGCLTEIKVGYIVVLP